MANVGFIGLGMMGLAMARNIVKAGHLVKGFDTNAEAVSKHVANGGVEAGSPAEAADGVDFVITMLPFGDIVKVVLLGENGVSATLSREAVVIDMSTINPLESDEIRDALAAKNIAMVDAPVGRTSHEAVSGELLIMAGGHSADIEKARPILECMGNSIVDCGGPGCGARMKVVNNFMSTVLNVLTAEALTLAEATGLQRDLVVDVLNGTTAGMGHLSTTYPKKVLQDDISPDFMIDLARKDLGIAIDVSKQTAVPLALAARAESVYAEAHERKRGSQDWTAIYAMLREKYL